MTRWKAVERRVARRLGGDRVPVADKRSTTDVISDTLAIEVKHRKSLPAWLHGAIQQAVDAATDNRLPMAVLHQLGQNSDNDFCVMRLADFEQLERAYRDVQYLKSMRPDDYERIFGNG